MKYLIFFLFFSPELLASWSKVPSTFFEMNPPPITGEKTDQEDFEILFYYQKVRTEKQCSLARTQPHPSFHDMFVLSGPLAHTDLSQYEIIVSRAMKLTERVSSYYKKKFSRPRPYSVEPKIRPCTYMPTGKTSYPSSHASSATIAACLLSYLYPEKSQEIIDYGQYLGKLRVISGVHHPSDVSAGQVLGQDICNYLLQNNEFIKELNKR